MMKAGAAETRMSGNIRSIQAMLAAVLMFSIMDTIMKLLSAEFPAMQVAALRSLSSLPLVCVYVAWRGGFRRGGARSIMQVRWPLHLLRAVIGIAMLALFAYGVRGLSLAEAYTIFFIGPILITALSVFVLKERVNRARWLAIAIGMAGVLVVLRPSGDGFMTLGGLAILVAAVCYAVSAVTGRVLARTDSSEQMVFWLMLMMALGATVLALPDWTRVEARHLPLLGGLAISGFLAQLALTEAFSHGEASVVAPFEYTALACGIGIDWVFWHTLPDQYTLIGAAIIIGSGLYLIRHETTHAEAEHP
jgi:drug/metabolite transporter (DMT)-like permease